MGFKYARTAANLTQRQAADALGVSDAAVSQWESGLYMPRAAMLIKIAELYGCSVDDLLRPNQQVKEEGAKNRRGSDA